MKLLHRAARPVTRVVAPPLPALRLMSAARPAARPVQAVGVATLTIPGGEASRPFASGTDEVWKHLQDVPR